MVCNPYRFQETLGNIGSAVEILKDQLLFFHKESKNFLCLGKVQRQLKGNFPDIGPGGQLVFRFKQDLKYGIPVKWSHVLLFLTGLHTSRQTRTSP